MPDATRDPRFNANPLVTGAPRIRFYAGAVLKSEEGDALGALCVMDVVPRPNGLTSDQAIVLSALADEVAARLDLRLEVEARRVEAVDHDAARDLALAREVRLLRVLDSGTVGWWEWRIRPDRVHGNGQIARLFGLSASLMAAGAPIASFSRNIHPLDQVLIDQGMEDAARTGGAFQEEFRIVVPHSEPRWLLARGDCSRDVEGRPDIFTGVVIDITDRKAAERAVRDADLGRELAMSAAHLGRFDHDLVTGRRFYDARALELLGLTEGQIEDVDALFLQIHPEDRQRVMAAQEAAKHTERSAPYRETYRVRVELDASPRWVRGVGRTTFSDGVCVRFAGVLEDVSEAMQAEEHRRELTRELDHRLKNAMTLVQAMADATLRSSSDLESGRAAVAARIGVPQPRSRPIAER